MGTHKAYYFQNYSCGLTSEALLHQHSPLRTLLFSQDALKGQRSFLTSPLRNCTSSICSGFCCRSIQSHSLSGTGAGSGYLCGWINSGLLPSELDRAHTIHCLKRSSVSTVIEVTLAAITSSKVPNTLIKHKHLTSMKQMSSADQTQQDLFQNNLGSRLYLLLLRTQPNTLASLQPTHW